MGFGGMFRTEEDGSWDKRKKIKVIHEKITNADAVVVGAGSGLSTAAGLTYSGSRFETLFDEFIRKYHMSDMYTAGFYPFLTQEEKWAYWSRHIYYNRYDLPAGRPYLDLYKILKEKNYFVITTNVDHQFYLAGFEPERIFATQGDYGMFQCARACHKKLYDNESQVRAMVKAQQNCRVPGELVPKCPVCGGEMEVNLRCDQYFVEDEAWHRAAGRYERFLTESREKRVVFLELGVGFNTPGIIKYPFWQMAGSWKRAEYICINQGQAWVPEALTGRRLYGSGEQKLDEPEARKPDDTGTGRPCGTEDKENGSVEKRFEDRSVCLSAGLSEVLAELAGEKEEC